MAKNWLCDWRPGLLLSNLKLGLTGIRCTQDSYVYVESVVLFRDMGFDGVDKTDRFIIAALNDVQQCFLEPTKADKSSSDSFRNPSAIRKGIDQTRGHPPKKIEFNVSSTTATRLKPATSPTPAAPASKQSHGGNKNLIDRKTKSSAQQPDHEATKAGVEQERTQPSFRSTS